MSKVASVSMIIALFFGTPALAYTGHGRRLQGQGKWMQEKEHQYYEGELQASPFMTALQVRQQFKAADFTFDFGEAIDEDVDSQIIGSNLGNFPALHGSGISMALVKLAPCAMSLPHTHPRATELAYVIEGEDVVTGFAEENGGEVVLNTLKPKKAAMFPEGLIHFQVNNGCKPATLLAGLSSEDAGLQTVTSQLFTFPDEVLAQAFGIKSHDVRELRDGLPSNPAGPIYNAKCLKRCNLD